MKLTDTLKRRVKETEAAIEIKREELRALITDLEAYRQALNAELRKQGLPEDNSDISINSSGHAPTYLTKSSAIFETIRAHPGLNKRQLLKLIKDKGIELRGNYFYDALIRFVERGQVKMVDKKYYIES